VTPLHNALVDAILGCRSHVIATMRSKVDYIMEADPRTGKTSPRKVGLAPIQREGMDYEFDIVGDMNLEHELIITKTRCKTLDGQVYSKPGRDVAATILGWLNSGTEPAPAGRQTLDPLICDTLEYYIEKAGITPDGVRKSLADRGVSTIDHLTAKQAEEMIDRLRTRIVQRNLPPKEAAQEKAPAPPTDLHPVSADILNRMEVEGSIMMGLQQLGDAELRLRSLLDSKGANNLSDLADDEVLQLSNVVNGFLAVDSQTPANAEDFTVGGDRPVRS
jgi:hypothetical protein